MPQPVQPPLQPAKPDCLVWYAGDPCDVLIQEYRRATELAQRKEWQVSVSAPLQKQIEDQQRLIKALQVQMAAQTNAALQGEARTDAIFQGIGAALGAALALIVALACFRRLARHTPVMKQAYEDAASIPLAGAAPAPGAPGATCDLEREEPVCSTSSD
jgi:hypothetical protein